MNDESERAVDGREIIGRLADEMLPTLIERLTNSELGELEVRENGWRIRLRRPGVESTAEAHASAAASGHAGARRRADGGHAVTPAQVAVPVGPAVPARGLVTSPAVGYFSPRNGVEPGTKVRTGDPLGHVDVLGVRHEVVSPIDGAVKAVEVQAGEAVEYGQPIAHVEVEA